MVTKARLDLSALTSVMDDEVHNNHTGGKQVVEELALTEIAVGKYQPRKHFDETSLQELANSIKKDGLIQPIVVRPKNEDGVYELIAGERRFRAHQMNGATHISALIEDKLSIYASFTENMQRENLSFEDTVQFISERLQAGDKITEIAKNTGLDKALLSKYSSFIDRPESVDKAYKAGLVSGVLNTYELIRLEKAHPEKTAEWIEDLISKTDETEAEAITARQIKLIRQKFEGKLPAYTQLDKNNETEQPDKAKGEGTQTEGEGQGDQGDQGNNASQGANESDSSADEHFGKKTTEPKDKDPNKLSKPTILCTYDKRECTLEYKQKPSKAGFVWVKYENGEMVEVIASNLFVDSIIEG